MDEVHIEKNLYRILQGRLRFKRDGLVLFINEPTKDILYESYDVYDEAFKKAYGEGVYIKDELIELLLEYDLWTPLDDRQAKEIQKQIDEHKIKAFHSYYKPRDLGMIKRQILRLQKDWVRVSSKKRTLDHTSCEGVAQSTRWQWIIYKTTYFEDGNLYDWKEFSVMDLMNYYTSKTIDLDTYRAVARNEPWRSMWAVGKNTALFDKPSAELTHPQSQLCAYSRMYDNVYESPDSPPEKVIEDDICLDGWFLVQKRKMDKSKKEREVNDLIQNPKIKQAGEIFVMAKGEDDIDNIQGMNTPVARGIVRQRQDKIRAADENVKHTDLEDVKWDVQIQRNKQFKEGRRT